MRLKREAYEEMAKRITGDFVARINEITNGQSRAAMRSVLADVQQRTGIKQTSTNIVSPYDSPNAADSGFLVAMHDALKRFIDTQGKEW